MKHVLRFDPGGQVACLYHEAIDLQALGRLQVVRATEISFCPELQQWEVSPANGGSVLFQDPSRAACLRWEQENLQPGSGTAGSASTNPSTP